MRSRLSGKTIVILVSLMVLIASLALGYTRARSVFSSRNSLTAKTQLNQMPQIILWAWERPTDLHFINPQETGVAFLARTIRLRSNEVVVRPRLQPLNLPAASSLIAVARVESDSVQKPELSAQQREKLADAIAEMASLPNVSHIQIDFDATKTERRFYRDVILEVCRRVPEKGLSITALASWCTFDDWISDLPIDEAVPMLFRMGPDRKEIVRRLEAGDDFAASPCRQSYGVSTDEPRSNLSSSRRLYVFNPDPWTESSVRAILESRK